jgi:hypothetical protein
MPCAPRSPDRPSRDRPSLASLLLATGAALLVSACGGAGDPTGSTPDTAPDSAMHSSAAAAGAAGEAEVATGTTVLELTQDDLADSDAARVLSPAFHVAPALLDPPQDTDVLDADASAASPPVTTEIPAGLDALRTGGLTAIAIKEALDAMPVATIGKDLASAPTRKSVATYTPAQIRAAYGLPTLPANIASLTAAQAAQFGAGQTIYIVNAHHGPNIVAELAAFNTKFGLPACTTRAIAPTASRPLAPPAPRSCDFSVVYTTAAGAMTTTAPTYDAGWATEIALDVQWAHAIAPLARIVLVEASDASVGSLVAAIRLANTLGPGVVSMSFGGPEGNWTGSVDSAFTAPGMSYLAATGDSGAQVNWPSVSSNVLAVGGTSLTWTGSGTRSEVGWSGTGGGISAFVPAPAYQAVSVPGMGSLARRSVADVAFNADPSTGQFVATIAPGRSTPNWISAGGTSLATPQWAGLVAIANATRALSAKSALGAPHPILYGQIAAVPGTYASAFADLTRGSHGSCATCSARVGYDSVGGLGTPNASSMVLALSGASIPPVAPVVTAAGISGQVGTPLSFTVSAKSANPLAYSLAGAPAGMAIAASGIVSWAAPVAGSHAVTVTARDTVTGLTGKAVYTVAIAAPRAPVVNAATVSGTPGVALSHVVSVSAPNAVSWTLAGAPSGMTLGSNGVLAWSTPAVGTYSPTVTARDSRTGLTGSAVITVKVDAVSASGLTITAPAMSGVSGRPLSGTISVSAPGATGLSIGISGVPLGMGFSVKGTTITAHWPSPRAGTYALKVSVRDSKGRSAQSTVPITVR